MKVVLSDTKISVGIFSRKLTEAQQSQLQIKRDMQTNQLSSDSIPLSGCLLKNQPMKFAVGFIKEGKIHIIPDADCFSIDPSLPSKRDASEILQIDNFQEQRQKLIEAYAPAKKRRQVSLAINAQIKDERIHEASTALEKAKNLASQVIEDDKSHGGGVLAQMQEILPKFDLTTNDPAKIYDISDKYLPDSLVASLRPEQGFTAMTLKWILDGCKVVPESHPYSLVLNLRFIHKLGQIFSASEHMKKKAFARFICLAGSVFYFFRLCKEKPANRSAEKIFADNEGVYDHLCQVFSGYGRVTEENRNRCFCCLLILILKLTPNYEFPFGLLLEDWKSLESQMLSNSLEFIGCKVSGGGSSNMVGKLIAPLQIPEVKKKLGKK
jgi:A49-like RNA polymerase I associated factor